MEIFSGMKLPLARGVCFALCGSLFFGCSGDDSDGDATGGGSGSGSGATGNGGGPPDINISTGSGMTGTTPVSRDDACVSDMATADSSPAVVQLVIDTSQSMNTNAPGETRSKWEATREALIDAIADLPDSTALGMTFYPNTNQTGGAMCIDNEVAVPVGLLDAGQRMDISDELNGTGPGGATPTHGALRFGGQTVGAADFPGNKFIVLITDGVPTYTIDCEGDPPAAVPSGPIVDEAASLLDDDIRTFVIGSPGSEDARSDLSEIADAGGTAATGCSNDGPDYCHFDMTTATNLGDALRGALGAIAGQILGCEYSIPTPPSGMVIDRNAVNVIYTAGDGTEQTLSPDTTTGGCTDGWEYDGDDIVLCGPTCDRVQNDPNGRVELLFGCGTEGGPPVE